MTFTKVVGAGIHTLSNITSHNLHSSGIITAIGLDISGNATIGGVLTYEDVTSIDSVGIVTARAGVNVSGGQLEVGSNIKLGNAGVITATSFVGSGAALTGIDATSIKDSSGNVKIQAQASGAVHTGISTFSGEIIANSNLTTNGTLHISKPAPILKFTETDNSKDFFIVGDSNTFIGQDNRDRLDFNAGGKRLVSIVEGTNIPVLIVDKDGVNTGAGNQGANYNANPNATDLVLGNTSSNNHGMTIVSPSSGYGNIQFSDGSGGGLDSTRGSIVFTHSDNKLNLKTKLGSIVLTHKDVDKLITTDAGVSIPKDLDVDGHTHLDNVSIAGVTTFSGTIEGNGGSMSGIHTVSTSPNVSGQGSMCIGNEGTYRFIQSHASQELRINPVGNDVKLPSGRTYIGSNYAANITNNANNRVITGGSNGVINGEAKLTFDGNNLRIDHGDTVDGILGEAYDGYFGLKHADQTYNSEYMILSQDSHTFISASSGSNVYIRYGGNDTTNQLIVGSGNDALTWRGNKIFHAGNDGSGSGLDSDTLDGLQATSFLRSDSNDTYSKNLTFSQDGQNGFLTTAGGTTFHNVGGSNSKKLVLRNLAELRFQDGSDWNYNEWAGIKFVSSTDTMYIGGPSSSNFTNNGGASNIDINFVGLNANGLKKDGSTIWHAANDGAGSGLDSDTVDGLQAASFLRSDADDTAGGRLTTRDILLQSGRHLERSSHHSGHLEGGYNNIGSSDANTSPIYTIGSSYNPDSTSLSNMYGIGFANSSNATFISTFNGTGNWGMYVAADGDARVWLDGGNGAVSAKGHIYGDRIYCSLQTTRYLSDVTGNYGSIQINGSGNQTWEGYSIDGRFVFMHDGGDWGGLYNDVDNDWFVYCQRQGYVQLRHNDTPRLETTSTGIKVDTNILLNGGNVRRANHHTGHLEGSYNNIGPNAQKSNPIYTIGSNYNPSDAALGDMYGVGYTHTDASFIDSNATSGWGLYLASDGDARVFLNASDGRIFANSYNRVAHHKGHLEGGYNSIGSNDTNTNPIFTIGSSYNPDSTALSNMYGIGFANSSNATFISTFNGTGNWGMYVAADGDARLFLDASNSRIYFNDASV